MVTRVESTKMMSLYELIRSCPYFTGLDECTLESIRSLMVKRTVEKQEVLWIEKNPAQTVYFVASGLVRLFKVSIEGKEQIIRLVRPGECFGHNGMLNGGRNPETAQAMVQSNLYGLSKDNFDTLLLNNNQFALNTIKSLAIEIHHYISLIEDLSLRRVSGRLARMLLEYRSDVLFDHSLIRTRGDMAAMTGSVREVIGKSLRALEEKGVIRSDSRGIVIKDSETLKAMAN